MSRLPSTPDCRVSGCERAAYKAHMCRQHYALVPNVMRARLTLECFQAQIETAARHHDEMARYVCELVAASE
jgi:hypothetical protein